MREHIYAMRFTGRAIPVGAAGSVLKATTTAPGLALTSRVDANGLAFDLREIGGESATFSSEVTFTGETSFQEIGTVTFGGENRLHFSTIGSGFLDASSDATRRQGTIMWKVDRGEGQFAGVTGLITSNFFVSEHLEVTDYQFGVLLMP